MCIGRIDTICAVAVAMSLASGAVASEDMVAFDGGATQIGSARGLATERPVMQRDVAPFRLDRTPVTVASFRAFVEETISQRFDPGRVCG